MKKIAALTGLLCLVATTLHAGPLKVYILAGQSNMQGHGHVSTLDYMGYDPATAPMLKLIRDANGEPSVFDNVHITYISEHGHGGAGGPCTKQGKLTVGYGGVPVDQNVKIGPELMFGIRMERELKTPILLIKTAWGGKSLNTDFRPPSAGAYELPEQTRALWETHPQGAHGVPAEEKREAWWQEKHVQTGHYYRLMIKHVKETLANIAEVYPGYAPEQGYELSGFVWFQGWNDMCDRQTYPASDKHGGYDEYSRLMAHFIRDVRRELNAPDLPFVIGVIGVDGDKAKGGIANLRPAMAAPAGMAEFKGTVAAVETGAFWDHRMAALMHKKGAVTHRLRAAHVIGDDGFIEKDDAGIPGWVPVGTPSPEDRVWRFVSVEPTAEADQRAPKEKKRYREITLPPELQDWASPAFDDSAWQSGKAPVGKGVWQHRGFPEVTCRSEWPGGEFILMRTTFDVAQLDYESFRISVLARQGFSIYLNGERIHTYIWWRDDPHYRAIPLEEKHVKLFKKGTNHLAIYANAEYGSKDTGLFGAVDVMIEAITRKDLDYVNSEANKLRLMDKECTREEGRIMMGASNGGYHYLGSAKMLSQIGNAFAEAMLRLYR